MFGLEKLTGWVKRQTRAHRAEAGTDLPQYPYVEANVARACTNCLAPATFQSSIVIRDGYDERTVATLVEQQQVPRALAERLRAGWPECWVPDHDPKINKPVGDVCPCCGQARSRPEYRFLSDASRVR